MLDPPVRLDLDAIGLTPKGVLLYDVVDAGGEVVTHVLDFVGRKNYPIPADFLEEARRFGVSRRIRENLNFQRLTPASRLILVHAAAWVENAAELVVRQDDGPVRPCPRHNAPHHPETVAVFDRSANDRRGELVRAPAGMCARLHWETLPGGRPVPGGTPRQVRRKRPSFEYDGRCAPEGVAVVYGAPAAFASFPFGRLVVVKDPSGAHQKALERITRAGLEAAAVDE